MRGFQQKFALEAAIGSHACWWWLKANMHVPNTMPAKRLCSYCVHPHLMAHHTLQGGKGLTIVSAVLPGAFKDRADDAGRAQRALKQHMEEVNVEGFAQVLMAPTVDHGLDFLIQGSGLGVLKHNTVVIGTGVGLQPHFALEAAIGIQA
jgi:hypothetical protein